MHSTNCFATCNVEPINEPRVIPMRIGRVRRPWVKNCIAAGLAAGFVEPLEATAIYSIEMTARWFMMYFPDQDIDPVFSKRCCKPELWENPIP